MMSEFERVCNVCGHVHVGSRAELARLTVCEGCGSQLPQGMRVHATAAPVATEEGAGEPQVLVCPHCGHRHEGTAERLSSLWYCEECAEPLGGVSPEAVARLTEPFFRADASRSRDGGGSGLGLHLAARALARLGAPLSLSCEDGSFVFEADLSGLAGPVAPTRTEG